MTELDRLRAVRIDGIQETLDGQWFAIITDPLTGTSACMPPGETIAACLARIDARYAEAEHGHA
jgi:hypothetical protein